MLNSLDLFSGYGGIALGLRKYCKPVGYCEIERYAQGILASRISSGELSIAPIYPDITKLRGEVNTVDILTGGFPCQDISVAGHGIGLEGKRSGLFFEIIRLAKETRAPFVFLENVPAIRTRGLREVIRAFTEIGYDCRWTCLSASSVGAPHKRERWFLLAHTNGSNLRNSKSKRSRGIPSELKHDGEPEHVADSKGNGNIRIKGKLASKNEGERESKEQHKNKNIKPVNNGWWKAEPNVGRVVDGGAFRMDRVKALGNGVVPLQVKTAFEKLMGLT